MAEAAQPETKPTTLFSGALRYPMQNRILPIKNIDPSATAIVSLKK